MSLPTSSDFNKFSNAKLTGTEWNQNVDKIVAILTNGNYDLNIDDITTDQATITTATITNLTATNANFTTIQNVSGNATAGSNSHIMANATNATLTVTLPQASDNANKTYVITKNDATYNPVKIDPNANELINGASDFYLNVPNESITILCDGTKWLIVNSTFDTNKSGKVVWLGGTALDSDVLELNGQYIDPAQYPRINSKYGTTWGSSGGNIQLPDARASFLKGKESGQSIGASLADMTAVNGLATSSEGNHRHSISFKIKRMDIGSADEYSYMSSVGSSTTKYTDYAGSHTHSLSGDSRTQPASLVGNWGIYI